MPRINLPPMPEGLGHLHGGLSRWVNDGIKPGGFLCAVLRNNLRDSVLMCSDPTIIPALVRYIMENLPSECWGSPDNFASWCGIERWLAGPSVEPEPEPDRCQTCGKLGKEPHNCADDI